MADTKRWPKSVRALGWAGLLCCACAAIGSDVPLLNQSSCAASTVAHASAVEPDQMASMRAALDQAHQSASQVIEEFERSHARAVRLQRENQALRAEVEALQGELSRLRTVEVGEDQSLTVRARPEGQAIGSLAHGVVVDVIECSTGDQRRWCHVSAMTGDRALSGWVAEDWLTPLLALRSGPAERAQAATRG
ncbi:MAG: hypothetical protein VX549_11360 [Pseudomonadota bacterium]|nr:hypothetical protein [Pseudomonadota bacterium]